MNDADFEVFREAVQQKVSVLQFLIEIILANQFGAGEAGATACEAFGKRVADHARTAPPNLPPGSGPKDVEKINALLIAQAVEIERIFSNAARRIRHPGSA